MTTKSTSVQIPRSSRTGMIGLDSIATTANVTTHPALSIVDARNAAYTARRRRQIATGCSIRIPVVQSFRQNPHSSQFHNQCDARFPQRRHEISRSTPFRNVKTR